MSSPLPILPTTVIGSYSMPEWLERAKNEYLSRRLSRRDLDEMHDAVRKAAIKDQEAAGIDVISDGEAQRDNMIDYFTERMPGVQVDQGSKRFYYDFYDSIVRSKLATGTLGLSEEAKFLSRFTGHPSKISISGPHTLVKRIQNKHYPTEEAFALDLGRMLNLELKELVRAGATRLQIDEPYFTPSTDEEVRSAVDVINMSIEGLPEDMHVMVHICQGNYAVGADYDGQIGHRYFDVGRYKADLVCSIECDGYLIEHDMTPHYEQCLRDKQLGVGAVDVQSPNVETGAQVAERISIHRWLAPEQTIITSSCGFNHLPRHIALGKLRAMTEAKAILLENSK